MKKSIHYERNTATLDALQNAGANPSKLHSTEQSIEIEEIAEAADADYDGWGTEVKR